jgi:hypothetical protein
MLGAVCAAMSLQWTVARSVGLGFIHERMPFLRTAKGGVSRKGPDFPAFWEAVIAALLLVGAATLLLTNYKQVHEINIFASVLLIQSLPFLAAVILASVEGTRFNSFAYWRGVEAKIGAAIGGTIVTTIGAKAADLLPQSQEVMTKVMTEPPEVSTDNVETAQ